MAEENEQYYDDFLKSESDLRANTPLPNNPNIILKNILSPADVEKVAIVRNDELYGYFDRTYDHRLQKEYDERIAPLIHSYNLPPIDYEARLPDAYFSAKAKFDAEKTAKENARNKIIETGTQEQLRNFDLKEENRSPSQAELHYGTISPYNLDKRIAIANLGYDPDLSIDQYLDPDRDIPGNFLSGKAALQGDLILNPRNMTKKQWEHLAKRHGLDGELRYMDPANPDGGVAYKEKGSDTWVQMDTPEMELGDVFTGIGRELPAIGMDLLFSFKAAKALEPILKKIPDLNVDFTSGPGSRFLQSTGIAVAAGGGTALGEFIRMTAGHATGANDLSLEEIMKQSGTMALLAAGGTAVIGVGLQVLPAIWTAMTKGRIPPELLRNLKERLIATRASQVDGVVPIRDSAAFGEALSEKELSDAIEKMVGATKKADWKPTMGQITGDDWVINLEAAFLKGSLDPATNFKYFDEILGGNDRLIMSYARELAESSREEVTKKYLGLQPTGAQLSSEIAAQIEKEIVDIELKAVKTLTALGGKLGNNLPISNIGVDIAGSRLLQKVVASDLSGGGTIRYRTRLNQAQHEYMEPFNKAVDDGINDPKWADTRIGSGSVREPTEAWMNARKKSVDDLLVNPEADEAVDVFYKMLGENGSVTLHRLLGKETVLKTTRTKTGKIDKVTGKEIIEETTALVPGKFKSGNFSFKELEQARVSINDIASGLIGKNALAVRFARSLERGVEAQQYQLIRKAAAEQIERETGKAATKKQIDKLVYHPVDNPIGTFGAEIYENWVKRNEAFELVHADSVGALIKSDRNAVIDSLLMGNRIGSPSNANAKSIMHLVRSQSGSNQVLEGAEQEIQRGLVERVKVILNKPVTPRKRALEYDQFIQKNKGTFKEVFGEGYDARFGTEAQFRRTIMRPLEKYEQSIKDIQKMFGTETIPNPSTTNVITGILNSSVDDIQGGIAGRKVEMLLPFLENNPVLMAKISAEIKDAISFKIVKRIEGRTTSAPVATAISDVFEGYSIKGAGNPNNTFENVIGPLLGKGGKKYIYNLRVLDELLQRNLVPSSKAANLTAAKKWTDPGVSWWKRMFIKPLTQRGRRFNAAERLSGTKAAKSMGQILSDQKLLDMTIKAAEGKATRRAYMKALIAWQIGTGQEAPEDLPFSDYWNTLRLSEVGSDFKNYDEIQKERKKKEEDIQAKRDSFNKTFRTLLENNIMMGIN